MDNIIKRLQSLFSDQRSVFNSIELNLGAMIGSAVLVTNPKLINLNEAPMRMDIEGLDLDGLQCLGVALLQKDRQPKANIIVAMAKRSLVCDALELATGILMRAARLSISGIDPFEEDNYLTIDVRELWNSRLGKAGSLIEPADREFFKKCVAPLYTFIQHNNGRLLPNKKVIYAGKPRSKEIDLTIEWDKETENFIKLQLSTAHDIFLTTREIVENGLERAIKTISPP